MTRHVRIGITLSAVVAAAALSLFAIGCGDEQAGSVASGPETPTSPATPTPIANPRPLPNPQQLYNQALASAQSLVAQGIIPQATVDYMIANQAQLSTDLQYLTDFLTPANIVYSYSPQRLGTLDTGGGVVHGSGWVVENIFGGDVGSGHVDVTWSTDGNTNEITGHTAAGGLILGGVSSKQIGTTWREECECSGSSLGISTELSPNRETVVAEPVPSEPGKCYRECGNYQICFKQLWGALSSWCSDTETICAPCP